MSSTATVPSEYESVAARGLLTEPITHDYLKAALGEFQRTHSNTVVKRAVLARVQLMLNSAAKLTVHPAAQNNVWRLAVVEIVRMLGRPSRSWTNTNICRILPTALTRTTLRSTPGPRTFSTTRTGEFSIGSGLRRY